MLGEENNKEEEKRKSKEMKMEYVRRKNGEEKEG